MLIYDENRADSRRWGRWTLSAYLGVYFLGQTVLSCAVFGLHNNGLQSWADGGGGRGGGTALALWLIGSGLLLKGWSAALRRRVYDSCADPDTSKLPRCFHIALGIVWLLLAAHYGTFSREPYGAAVWVVAACLPVYPKSNRFGAPAPTSDGTAKIFACLGALVMAAECLWAWFGG